MLLVAAGMSMLNAACQRPAALGPRTPDGLSCGQRLVGGVWRFSGFNPDQPLTPDAARALERLHGSLSLQFNGQQSLTTGPGIHHVGPYQIADDTGLSCRLIAPDDAGVISETTVRFVDRNQIEVVDRRSAVPGRSLMTRPPTP